MVAMEESAHLNKHKCSLRSANPLGKLMDFLQEDVDSMQVGGGDYC